MATKIKNVAVLCLVCILVSAVAFQFCEAGKKSDLMKTGGYKDCLRECEDKCKADGGSLLRPVIIFVVHQIVNDIDYNCFCFWINLQKKQSRYKAAVIKDVATLIKKRISKATTNRIQSTDAGLVALFGIFMLALFQ
ncbi:hypothetical protein MKX01_008102 [Papaver californicum]|nr:hypothetical protein MKX01_008102 [Papaver californicum]